MSGINDLRRRLEGMREAHLQNADILERLAFANVKLPRFYGELAPTLTIEQVIRHQYEEAENLRLIIERVDWRSGQ